MIESIHIQGLKNHRDTTIRLGRATLLVGPNGAGKTGVLLALQIVARLAGRSAAPSLEGWTKPAVLVLKGVEHLIITIELPVHTSSTESEPSCEMEFDLLLDFDISSVSDWRNKISLEAFGDRTTWKRSGVTEFQGGWTGERSGVTKFQGVWTGERIGDSLDEYGWRKSYRESDDTFFSAIPPTFHFKPSADRMAQPCYSDAEIPRLEPDGYGLASCIAYLMTFEPERFRLVEERARQVIPTLQRIRIRPARVEVTERRVVTVGRKSTTVEDERTVTGHELMLDMSSGEALPAHAVSEGTLMAIGVLTAVLGPESPGLVLLDDIDKALHPKAQKELVRVLRAILEQFPELQIVATSHSPYLVDEFAAGEVWVMAADGEGIAHAKCLADHPNAEWALKVLRTGEFLSAEGEDWVIAPGAAEEATDALRGDR